MKRLLLFSSFVLTQTLFATTLTIYNSEIALVEESRAFNIEQKEQELNYNATAKTVLPNSINADFPKEVTLHSQAYRKASGQREASLSFDIESAKKMTANVTISYLAQGISFTNDYVLSLEKERARLTAWADITNNSHKDFKNASVSLIAGELHRASSQTHPIAYRTMALTAQKTLPQEHAVAGYHRYTLPRKIDINANEQRRVKLFESTDIKLTHHYSAMMNNPLYLMGERSSSVTQEITLSNIKQPLPQGLVRIYTRDKEQKLLLGEDIISNTPKNRALTLKLGKDYDTKISQTMLERNDTKEQFDVTVKYSISNNSDEDKSVTLLIPFNKKRGSTVDSKLRYVCTKGNLVTFTLKVKANSQRSFDVRFKSKRR